MMTVDLGGIAAVVRVVPDIPRRETIFITATISVVPTVPQYCCRCSEQQCNRNQPHSQHPKLLRKYGGTSATAAVALANPQSARIVPSCSLSSISLLGMLGCSDDVSQGAKSAHELRYGSPSTSLKPLFHAWSMCSSRPLFNPVHCAALVQLWTLVEFTT